jgi:transcription antitermination factor NusG
MGSVVENLLRRGNSEAMSEIPEHSMIARLAESQGHQERRWYAVYTSPCHEKQVATHLTIREIEHFLPLYRSTRRWRNRSTVTLELPLFPSYLFVQASREDRGRVLSVPGILSIVGTNREALPLPDGEIDTLRNGLRLHKAEPYPFLKVGEKARIRSGSLAGMQGIVLHHKNQTRLVLTLDLIMKSVAVEVDAADLEPVHLPKYIS